MKIRAVKSVTVEGLTVITVTECEDVDDNSEDEQLDDPGSIESLAEDDLQTGSSVPVGEPQYTQV